LPHPSVLPFFHQFPHRIGDLVAVVVVVDLDEILETKDLADGFFAAAAVPSNRIFSLSIAPSSEPFRRDESRSARWFNN